MPSTSSRKTVYSFGHTINFLDSWLLCFYDNYQSKIAIYKNMMSELFETIPKLHHPREVDDYKENTYTTIRAVGDE